MYKVRFDEIDHNRGMWRESRKFMPGDYGWESQQGPILAVLVTRYIDNSRLKQTRRMDVFRTLMRTRRMRLNPDHVGALNLVEIEFYGEHAVIEKWKSYWTHLRQSLPVDANQQQQFLRDQEGLLTKLLHAIATTLKFDIQQMEIFEGGYVPQGWVDDDQSVRVMRVLILEILNGRRGLPITPLNVGPNNPYPPAPAEVPPPPVPR